MRRRLDPLHAAWPDADRAAWEALSGHRPFLDRTPAEHWRPETKRQAAYAYDRWLRFLCEREPDTLAKAPVDRLEAAILERFVEHLGRGTRGKALGDRALASTLNHFTNALRVIVPDYEPAWLAARKRDCERRARNGARAAPVASAPELADLAQRLMADTSTTRRPLDAAIRYRDGLILALLLATALRRRSLLSLTMGRSFRRTGDTYRIAIAGEETKSGLPIEQTLGAHLTPLIERYLREFRPRFPGNIAIYHLFPSSHGGALGDAALSGLVRRRTSMLGAAMSPHQFRHVAATAIAASPIGLAGASHLLRHASLAMTARHYCRGDTLKASRTLGRVIDAIRHRHVPGPSTPLRARATASPSESRHEEVQTT